MDPTTEPGCVAPSQMQEKWPQPLCTVQCLNLSHAVVASVL